MIDDFMKMYAAELQELASAERQLEQCLPAFADMAEHESLKTTILDHASELHERIDVINELLSDLEFDEKHVDHTMEVMTKETERWAKMVQEGTLRDAGLISSLQRINHYEMAVFATLAAWAIKLGRDDDLRLYNAILEEEEATNDNLFILTDQLLVA